MAPDVAQATPGPAPGATTRDRILEVAEEIISRVGMEGMRLKDVAEGVGIQPPSIFAHFEGREAIGNAIANRVLEQIAVLVEQVVAESPDDPLMALRRCVRAVAGHLYDHPAHARLLLRDLARSRSGGELSMWTPTQDRIDGGIAAVVRAGVETGQIRPVAPEAILPIFEGAILAFVGWWGFDESGRPATSFARETIQDHIEDLVLAHLRPR